MLYKIEFCVDWVSCVFSLGSSVCDFCDFYDFAKKIKCKAISTFSYVPRGLKFCMRLRIGSVPWPFEYEQFFMTRFMTVGYSYIPFFDLGLET